MVSILLFTRFLNIQPVVSRISEPSSVLVILIALQPPLKPWFREVHLCFFPWKLRAGTLTKITQKENHLNQTSNCLDVWGSKCEFFRLYQQYHKKILFVVVILLQEFEQQLQDAVFCRPNALRLAKGHAETMSEMGVRHEYVNPLCFYHKLCLKNASKRLAI